MKHTIHRTCFGTARLAATLQASYAGRKWG